MSSTNLRQPPPVALTIAGSDPSGGAGIQADLKTFAAHGIYGLGAITCSTAQVPGHVADVAPVTPEHLRSQLQLLLACYPVGAIKTGMLYSISLMEVVVGSLADHGEVPLVIDPVMIASSGDSLLEEEAIEFYKSELLPRATLFTPNLDEASVLLDDRPISRRSLEPAARDLHARYGANVLLKGGHLLGDEATDVLISTEAGESFTAPFVPDVSTPRNRLHLLGCDRGSPRRWRRSSFGGRRRQALHHTRHRVQPQVA